jgi:hypothetical protein
VRSFLAAAADHCSSSVLMAAAALIVLLSIGADGAQEAIRKADEVRRRDNAG